MAASMVYVTAPDMDEARRIGSVLVEKRLAACVNILPAMESLYWWQGRVESAAEVVVVAKTRTELVGKVTETVVQVHSYDCPCVVSWPLIDGHPDFFKWIDDETR